MPHLSISCWKASLLLHRGHLAWWHPAALANLNHNFLAHSLQHYRSKAIPGHTVSVEPSFTARSPEAELPSRPQWHSLQTNSTLTVPCTTSFPSWGPTHFGHLLAGPVLLAKTIKSPKEERKTSRPEKTW